MAKSDYQRSLHLTKRELEVAKLIASGLKNSEIAKQLHVSQRTIESHASGIYAKTDLRNRVQITNWIHQNATSQSN